MPPKKREKPPNKSREPSEDACNRGRPYFPRNCKKPRAALSSSDPLEKPSKEAISLMASEGLTLAHVSTQVATLEASDQQLTTTFSDAATDVTTPPQPGEFLAGKKYSFEHFLAWGAHLAKTFKHPTIEALFQRALDHLPTMRVTPAGEYSAPCGKSKEFTALLDVLGFDRSESFDIGHSAKAAKATALVCDASMSIYRAIQRIPLDQLVNLVKQALSLSPSDPEDYIATAISEGSCARAVDYIKGVLH